MPPIVLSMTTIPSRNGTLGPTLRSLEAQTLKADEIRIYAISGCDLPSLHGSIRNVGSSAKVYAEITDAGPVTKLMAAFDPTIQSDAMVITVDDDIIYEPKWLQTLVAGSFNYPDEAVGMSGWMVRGLLSTGKFHFARDPGPCDVLEGWAGIVYRPSFFKTASVMMPPDELRYVDDVWISGHLAKAGIGRRVIHSPMSKDIEKKPGLHHHPDFAEINRLAANMCFPAHL